MEKKEERAERAEELRFAEDIAAEVRADFDRRAELRRPFEAQWQLNTNFVLGNQYCTIGPAGEVEDTERDYYWQERETFNHIASIVETRLAKLGRVRPKMSVRPASPDEGDIRTAKAASKILASACQKLETDEILTRGTMWSELTGSVFYKITWDGAAGRTVGEDESGRPVAEGDVRVDVCPPYEIYPDSEAAGSVDECNSLIHAKAVHVEDIRRIWGKTVQPEETEVAGLTSVSVAGGLGSLCAVPKAERRREEGFALVIERYTRPTADKPEGELIITAGGELLHYGPLPYLNGSDGKRTLPFIGQNALTRAGCFFGTSMVERAIPIQRAYNAVKNRKHEFMNRISMGVLAVEDGSVDTENLEDEGLSPGKILVYRQGSAPPRLLDAGHVPSDFAAEEDRLLNEFISVSGVSEIMRSSAVPSALTSGVALQLLIEQDDTRLSVTAENIRTAVRRTAQHMLRLYKQFAAETRLSRFVGEDGEVELIAWDNSNIDCDDVVFDTENELNSTPATKQNMMFELLRAGLLHDENGKLSDTMRYKILDALGYGGWEFTRDVKNLQNGRAAKENMRAAKEKPRVREIDDHALHIAEHTKFMLSSDFDRLCGRHPSLEARMNEHIREHRQYMSLEKENEHGGEGTSRGGGLPRDREV